MLLKVSWRNVWRNRKRSLIIMAAVSIGLATGIFLMAFYNGMIEQRVNTAVQEEISHLQIHQPEFRKDYDVKYYLENSHKILEVIRSQPQIKAATGRIILKGMIASPSGSGGITINGVVPEEEEKATGLNKKIIEGRYFNPVKGNEIIIGEKLLKKLKLNLLNKTVLTFQDREGNIASAAFRIAGIFKTVNTPYDETNVFVNITDIDSLAGLKGRINEIAVLLSSNTMLDETQEYLEQQFPAVEVMNWKEISPEVGLTVSVADQMVYIFMIIILTALAFGIVNTMLMAVLERTREIGILLALGMNRPKIFAMILAETFFLVLAGCPTGIAISLVAVSITNKTGISFSKFAEVYSSFGYSDTIYPSLAGDQFVIIMLLVIMTALFSSLFPSWKALRIEPAVSIRK